MKALSIRQPWAWAILNAHKDVENRSWGSSFRGEFLIHAAKGLGKQECSDALATIVERNPAAYWTWPGYETIERGGIVGVARIVGCIEASASRWHIPGCFGFVLVDVRPLPFIPCAGKLGFWNVPADVVAQVDAARAA